MPARIEKLGRKILGLEPIDRMDKGIYE